VYLLILFHEKKNIIVQNIHSPQISSSKNAFLFSSNFRKFKKIEVHTLIPFVLEKKMEKEGNGNDNCLTCDTNYFLHLNSLSNNSPSNSFQNLTLQIMGG
jgi:hypothetical protein